MKRLGLLGLMVACSAPAWAQNAPGPVVLEGDTVAGVGLVTRIDNLAVNSFGQWLVEADTDHPDTDADVVLLQGFGQNPGGVYLRENQALTSPPGALLDSFDSVNLNDQGNSGWNFFLDGTSGSSDDSGIFFDTTLVIQEGDFSTAPEFSPNTPYIGFFDAKISNNNEIFVVASIDDPAIDSSVDRALVRITNPQSVFTETVIAKEGDEPIPGRFIDDFGTGPHQSQINAAGSAMYIAELDGDSADDNAVYIDSTLIAREGSPSPAPGRNYEFLTRTLDLNNNGGWVLRANLDGDTASDEVIVANDTIVISEGDPVPSLPAFSITGFGLTSGPIWIDDNGNILWYAEWDDATNNEGLFLNDQLIVQAGVTQTVGGQLITDVRGGQDNFALSANGQWVLFEAEVDDAFEGAFLLEIPQGPELCPADCNCDGLVNFQDIPFLKAALGNNEQAWADLYDDLIGGTPPCDFQNCNADEDPQGLVNFQDIPALKALLGTSCD